MQQVWELGVDASMHTERTEAGREFSVRAQPIEALDQARDLAARLAGELGRPATVYALEGAVAQRLLTVPVPGGAEPPPDARALDAMLARALATHMGAEQLVDAPALRFEFVRRTPEQEVSHVYLRSGEDRSLAVELRRGEGRSSLAVVEGDRATLAVEGQPAEEQDPARTREVIDEFAPSSVLGLALGLQDVLLDLRAAGPPADYSLEVVNGRPAHVLSYDAATSSVQQLALAVDGSRIQRIAVRGRDGLLMQRYEGWQEVVEGGLAVPRLVITERDGEELVRVELTRLVLDEEE